MVALNEGFKALVRETFPEKSDRVICIFDEVVQNKASNDSFSIKELKDKAIDEIKGEIATRDFVRAEIAEVRAEIAEVKESLRAEIANTKVETLKWVFGLQASTIVIILGAMKYMLG